MTGNKKFFFRACVLLTLTGLLLFGCAQKILVKVEPKVDLTVFKTIGLVSFSSNSSETLNQFATQKLISIIQEAQPGTRFLELGSKQKLFNNYNGAQLTPEEIKDIGIRYNVRTIFTGNFNISELKPSVSIGRDLSSIDASAMVEITCFLKHWDTEAGSTLWTKSRSGKWPMANLSATSDELISLNISNPKDKYGNFLEELLNAITVDFKYSFEKRVVSKK